MKGPSKRLQQTRRSGYENDRQQRFSFRKYAVGLVSVVVRCLFFWSAVLAQEQEGTGRTTCNCSTRGKKRFNRYLVWKKFGEALPTEEIK